MEDFWLTILNQFNSSIPLDILVLTEPPGTTKDDKEKILELVMEQLQFNFLYLASAPTLALFSLGIETGLVIDSGEAMTSITPIFDGCAMKQSQVKINIGGSAISERLESYLNWNG